jgi:hypothetical protein
MEAQLMAASAHMAPKAGGKVFLEIVMIEAERGLAEDRRGPGFGLYCGGGGHGHRGESQRQEHLLR